MLYMLFIHVPALFLLAFFRHLRGRKAHIAPIQKKLIKTNSALT